MRSFIQKWVGRSAWEPLLRRGEADSPLGGFFLGCCGGYTGGYNAAAAVPRARPSANVAHYYISRRLRRRRVTCVNEEAIDDNPVVLPVYRYGPPLETQEEAYLGYMNSTRAPPVVKSRQRLRRLRDDRDVDKGKNALRTVFKQINMLKCCTCGLSRHGASMDTEVYRQDLKIRLEKFKLSLRNRVSIWDRGTLVCKRRFRQGVSIDDVKKRYCCGKLDHSALPLLPGKVNAQSNVILDPRYRPDWLTGYSPSCKVGEGEY